MLDIVLTPNLPELEKMLGPEFKRQARYAMAQALTKTAKGAQARLRGTLPADFTVRSKWTAGSIQITSARKTNLEATVGSTADYMRLQAEGGDKQGRTGKDVGVPVGARPTPMSRTTLAKHPAKMLTKKRYFVATMKSGKTGIWRRTGKKRLPIKLMWLLQPKVHVRARWDFIGQVQTFVGVEWPRRLHASLDEAIKTAR